MARVECLQRERVAEVGAEPVDDGVRDEVGLGGAHLQRGADGRFRFRFSPAAAVVAWSEMARPAVSLAGLGVPTLLVRAAQADFVSDAVVDGFRADLGDAFALETLDTSHMLYWDAFDETAAVVRRFLGA